MVVCDMQFYLACISTLLFTFALALALAVLLVCRFVHELIISSASAGGQLRCNHRPGLARPVSTLQFYTASRHLRVTC